MTAQGFVAYVEGYYGRYQRPAQKQTVVAYLSRFGEQDLSLISRRLILDYSGQFRFTPDVAILEGIARKLDAECAWEVPLKIAGPMEPDDGGKAAAEFDSLVDRLTKTKLEWRKERWAKKHAADSGK